MTKKITVKVMQVMLTVVTIVASLIAAKYDGYNVDTLISSIWDLI